MKDNHINYPVLKKDENNILEIQEEDQFDQI